MNVHLSQTDLFRYGNFTAKNTDGSNAWADHARNADSGQGRTAGGIRRMLSADSAYSYTESLRTKRAKAKETSLKLKELQYDFKAISTQILRSKTSASAKQVAARARREVIRLKRQRQNGEYDDEALQSAIAHAQAMERTAKKKARHLEEEEMAKSAGGPCAGEMELEKAQEEIPEKIPEDLPEEIPEYAEELQAAFAAGFQKEMPEAAEDMMSELMREMSDSMEELMEEMGFSELADSMSAAEPEMDPEDFKKMKLKHRLEEMKAIAEADSKYLKALFDRLERMKGMSSGGVFSSGGSRIDVLSAPGEPGICAPGASVPETAGFDISV